LEIPQGNFLVRKRRSIRQALVKVIEEGDQKEAEKKVEYK
jgi:hypothetical protein